MTKQSPNDVRDKIIRQLLGDKNLHEDKLYLQDFTRRLKRQKSLPTLKLMDLRSCSLTRVPNLSSIAPDLEFLYLNGYPSLAEIPSLQNLSKLVELHMRCSKLIQPWSGGDKPLGSLKLMDLSYSCNLIRIPDLSSIAPNLEFLYLDNCKSLVEVPSFQNLSNLVELHMRYSKLTLAEIPSLQNLSNLVELRMSSSQVKQPFRGDKHLGKLKLMDLSYTSNLIGIPDLSSIAPNLEFSYLTGCWSLVEIPSLQNVSNLVELLMRNIKPIKLWNGGDKPLRI
ncbi:hypothetical protein GH714_022293 [Hevea brasiliensis]|uniref:Uncharacterized protein n=1 Tax=Hevea brasiliensis TaxID=3981 RepID=A0A6A6N1R2_HEVBR|nr:hypothetical protein GH714_022293 [Hevea brasiliensis]